MRSSFKALTRLKGSDDQYRMATWKIDYFGDGHDGVRFLGEIDWQDGDDYEIDDEEDE